MKRYTHIFTMALLIICTCSQGAFADYLPEEERAQEAVESSERLRAFIAGSEFVASRLSLRLYSPDVVADLQTIIDSRDASADTRARAIKCLALYATDGRARRTMEQLFEETAHTSKVFPQIVVSYMEQRGEDVALKVAPLLEDERRNVRLAAVIALGRFGGQTGYARLLEAQDTEDDPKVMERMMHYAR